MNKDALMGELRAALEAPSNEIFGQIITHLLNTKVQNSKLIEEVTPYVEERLLKD